MSVIYECPDRVCSNMLTVSLHSVKQNTKEGALPHRSPSVLTDLKAGFCSESDRIYLYAFDTGKVRMIPW